MSVVVAVRALSNVAAVALAMLLASVSGANATASGLTVGQVGRDGSGDTTLFTITPTPDQFTVADPDHLVTVAPTADGANVSLVSLADGATSVLGQLPGTVLAVATGSGLVAAATCKVTSPGDCDASGSLLWILQPGSSPREIASVPFAAGLTWGSLVLSPDGRTLAVSTFNSCLSADCRGYELRLVQISTGATRRIGYHGRWQSFSPDDRYVAYVGALRGDPEDNVMVYDRRRGTVRRLGLGWATAWAPRSPDRLAFAGRTLRLFDGRTTQMIANKAEADIWGTDCCDYFLAWSPDGRALGFTYVPTPVKNNWVPRLAILRLKPRRIFLLGAQRMVDDPEWSPDSRELVYAASSAADAADRPSHDPFTDDTQLFVVSATTQPRQITSQPHPGPIPRGTHLVGERQHDPIHDSLMRAPVMAGLVAAASLAAASSSTSFPTTGRIVLTRRLRNRTWAVHRDDSTGRQLIHDAVAAADSTVDFSGYPIVFIVLPESAGLGIVNSPAPAFRNDPGASSIWRV